jgi:hypothetical protein
MDAAAIDAFLPSLKVIVILGFLVIIALMFYAIRVYERTKEAEASSRNVLAAYEMDRHTSHHAATLRGLMDIESTLARRLPQPPPLETEVDTSRVRDDYAAYCAEFDRCRQAGEDVGHLHGPGGWKSGQTAGDATAQAGG